MRSIVLAVLVLAACTKPNPNVCCTDEADCNAKGIPVGSQCGDGLLCRGNQCIAQPCAGSSECDSSAPYCVAESCAETCTEDAQCPGFSQATDMRFCESSECVECRTSADCGAESPVCDAGACRLCVAHDECAAGVCKDDGTCAAADEVAYVDASGSSSAECTQTSPCSTITYALDVTPRREYLLVEPGTYTNAITLNPAGKRSIIGRTSSVILRRSTVGPIASVFGGSDLTLQNVELRDATGTTGNDTELGNGILCNSGILKLRRTAVVHSALNGVFGNGCTLTATDSSFTKNQGLGVNIVNSTGTFDRCVVSENADGMNLDDGVYSVTNSFIVRNVGSAAKGIALYSVSTAQKIEFNTIADNIDTSGANVGFGINCNLPMPIAFPNNIIVRNTRQTSGQCSYPSSIISDADVSSIHFKSPDAAPYDYHLTAGSMAIDGARSSTLDHDFDGDARPNGDGRDVGADEYVP